MITVTYSDNLCHHLRIPFFSVTDSQPIERLVLRLNRKKKKKVLMGRWDS
ncbi:unnamed protein product [Brassica rapa subsp. trilocularis]